ncbi:ABC transporter permease [bacterium]|nr:ABC transporter permease [bacterium]NBX72503.1 ABC transporter permease [bacterium]
MSKSYLECQYVALKTISYKEVKRFLRIWIQTLLPTPITVLLYFLIFGALLGERLGEVGEFSYILFMTPGLIMLGIINNAFSNVVSSFFISKFQRSIEEILVAPVEPLVILLGYASGGVLRGLLVGALVLVMSKMILGFVVSSYVFSIMIAVLTAYLFSLAGLLNAVFATKFDDIAIVPTFILTPLIYLGGVFYDASALPTHFKWIVSFNPLYYMINGFRAALLGHGGTSMQSCLSILIVSCVFLTGLNLYYLRKK